MRPLEPLTRACRATTCPAGEVPDEDVAREVDVSSPSATGRRGDRLVRGRRDDPVEEYRRPGASTRDEAPEASAGWSGGLRLGERHPNPPVGSPPSASTSPASHRGLRCSRPLVVAETAPAPAAVRPRTIAAACRTPRVAAPRRPGQPGGDGRGQGPGGASFSRSGRCDWPGGDRWRTLPAPSAKGATKVAAGGGARGDRRRHRGRTSSARHRTPGTCSCRGVCPPGARDRRSCRSRP